MADTKITALTQFSVIATNDVMVGVDVSDTSMASTGTNKYLTVTQFLGGGNTDGTNLSLQDSTTFIFDNVDNTKKVQFQVSGVTTATTRTLTIPDANTTIVGTDATQIITNKRITPRIGTETSSATSTPTADTVDQWNVTALAVADAFAAPTGTPTDGQDLIIRIKDNGTARALTWNAIYRASSDLALPSTTILSKTLYLGFRYNAADSKWDLLAVLNNF